MPILEGRILTPDALVSGVLEFDSHIAAIRPAQTSSDHYVLPGFIDTHVHGGGGADAMDGLEGVQTLARFHARHGTTTLLPTTMTNPWERVMAALEAVRRARAEGVSGGADIPGAHLEGPFISPQRLGAQPDFTLLPTPSLLEQVLGLGVVRTVTVAPELAGMLEAAQTFARAGVRVSVGHTAGTAEHALALHDAVLNAGGVAGTTHLYNAMGGLFGREPGPLGAALSRPDVYAELILDLHHVSRTAFLAAFYAKKGRLHLITDAIRATGTDTAESELGGQRVIVQGGRATLEDGTLAGSVLTLDVALRNALGCGLSLEQVSKLLSKTPARYLGLEDRGELRVGLRADVVVLSSALEVEEVWVGGVRVR